MKLALSSKVIDENIERAVDIINSTIQINLPAVSCNRENLIYGVTINDDSNILVEAYRLGNRFSCSPKEMWKVNKLMIARCLPEFVNDTTKAYRELMSVINTNSASFITLIDPIVDSKIQDKIMLDSYLPIFSMDFPITAFTTFAHTLNDDLALLQPSHNVEHLIPSYQTDTDSLAA